MARAKSKPYPGTQSVLRAVRLLQTFTDERPSWSLMALAETLDLNRTTVYRLITALQSADLLAQDPDTEEYRLGSGMIVLGGRAMRANRLRPLARRELERLAAQTGETATLEILSGHEVVIIDEALGEHLMSGTQSVGTRWPAHATSTGKVLLAFAPDEVREAALAQPLPPLTEATITTPAALRTALDEVRARGFGVARDELERGYTAVGAPIRNHDEQVVAAVSLGAPSVRLTAAQIPQMGRLVMEAAARLSHQLGYRQQ